MWSPVYRLDRRGAMTSIPEILPTPTRLRGSVIRVAIVIFDGVSSLDLSGPLSIFAGATHFLREQGKNGYECTVVSLKGKQITTDLGAAFVSKPVRKLQRQKVDTLVIPGAMGAMDAALADRRLLAWIAQQGRRVRRVCSVCAGARLLAAAGLAEGRRMVTHWAHCGVLQKQNPGVKVEQDPIYIEDGPIWSSAGVTAGIDLTLALVEQDFGRDLAMTVARQHVVFMRRTGGQSQFSALLEAQIAGKNTFAKLHEWAIGRLGDKGLNVDQLAERAGMSPRNFARVYKATTGRTPAKAIEFLRIEEARRLLEDTETPIDEIADKIGFGGAERMRTTFQRHLKVSPREYRLRFGLS
jgi:transcriptional regulator GlxA family with amidase domain